MTGRWTWALVFVLGSIRCALAHDSANLQAPDGADSPRGEVRAHEDELRVRGEDFAGAVKLTIWVDDAELVSITTESDGDFDFRISANPADFAGKSVEVKYEDGSTALSGKLPGSPDDDDDDGRGEAALTPPVGAPLPGASGKVEVKGEDGRHALEVKVRNLTEGVVYTVSITNDAGETEQIGKITTGAGGIGALEVDTRDGGSLPFGAAGVGELAGLAITVKDPEGVVVLAGRVPVLGQNHVEEDEVQVEFELARTANATSRLRGEVRIETERGGDDKIRVRVREALPGAVFSVTIHRPVEGEEPAREEVLEVTIDDDDRGETEIRGNDILPLNAASLAELGGAILEVWNAAGKVVLSGKVPQVGDTPVKPVHVPHLEFVVVLGPASYYSPGGKVEFEEEDDEHEIEVEIQDLLAGAAYRVELRAGDGSVAVLFEGVADRFAEIRERRVFFGSEPLPLGVTSFAQYDGHTIVLLNADGATVIQGTVKIPGAGGGAALGVSFSMVGDYDAPFLRGDADRNFQLDITDAVRSLEALFLGRSLPVCADAMDTNDDGQLDISDALLTLLHLFQDGRELPYPGSQIAGFDRTADELFCRDN